MAYFFNILLLSSVSMVNSTSRGEGEAMGSPVSAVVANLYMEFFEGLALNAALARPRIWKRYVDDTLMWMGS